MTHDQSETPALPAVLQGLVADLNGRELAVPFVEADGRLTLVMPPDEGARGELTRFLDERLPDLRKLLPEIASGWSAEVFTPVGADGRLHLIKATESEWTEVTKGTVPRAQAVQNLVAARAGTGPKQDPGSTGETPDLVGDPASRLTGALRPSNATLSGRNRASR